MLRKIDAYRVEEYEAEKIVPEVILATKTLNELEADLKQAQDSRVYVYEQQIKPIDDTIALMQAKVDEAKAQGVVVKPVEEVKEIPVAELPVEKIIAK